VPKYLFLDNWVLSDYTKDEDMHLLSEFIQRNDYTILIDSLSLAELYNPDWRGSAGKDRTARAAELLGQHSCMIVDPQMVWRAELQAFPDKLEHVPVEFSLGDIPAHHRTPVLLMLLRRHEIFLQQGKDITQWAARYKTLKSDWPGDVERIIEHACKAGDLVRDRSGKFIDLQHHKEKFLRTLDGRHLEPHFEDDFTLEERKALRIRMQDVENGATAKMPAIRASSLYFWYAYIEPDKAYTMKRHGSDIGDYFQMSLIPYCSAFTVDTTMYRLANRVLNETSYHCELLDHKGLDARLNSLHTP
jgi:hypothetical protein